MRKEPVEVVRRFLYSGSCYNQLITLVAESALRRAETPTVQRPGSWKSDPEYQIETPLAPTCTRLLGRIRKNELRVASLFGAGGNVAVFGTVSSDDRRSSPPAFSLLLKISGGKITHLQYLEDVRETISTNV